MTDFTSISQDCNFEDDDKRFLLNEVISEHFMRQGMLHIADALIEVNGLKSYTVETHGRLHCIFLYVM